MALDPCVVEEILRNSKGLTAQVVSGGNSSVTRVALEANVYAIKDYSNRSDGLARKRREWEALTLLKDVCPGLAPYPIWCSDDQPLAIHSWIDGSKPIWGIETVTAMTKILDTLKYSYDRIPQGYKVRNATDAVVNVTELAIQVFERLGEFGEVDKPEVLDISRRIRAELKNLSARLTRRGAGGTPHLTLSPSDFGPHNMIHSIDERRYRIIDLEFFGIDDVHKLIGDTILHPQIFWTPELLEQFLDEMASIFNFSGNRLSDFLPFLSLKWAVIVCNRLARFDQFLEKDNSRNQLSELAIFYVDVAQIRDVDAFLSRIVERASI